MVKKRGVIRKAPDGQQEHYSSVTDAAKSNAGDAGSKHTCRKYIRLACEQKTTYKGFSWQYADDPMPAPPPMQPDVSDDPMHAPPPMQPDVSAALSLAASTAVVSVGIDSLAVPTKMGAERHVISLEREVRHCFEKLAPTAASEERW